MPALTPPATSDDTERNAGRRGPYTLNDEQAKWEPKEDALTLRWPRPPSSPASGALGSAPIHLHLSRPCMRVFRVFLPRDAASLFAFLHGPVFSRDSSEIPDSPFCNSRDNPFLPFCTSRFCLFVYHGSKTLPRAVIFPCRDTKFRSATWRERGREKRKRKREKRERKTRL